MSSIDVYESLQYVHPNLIPFLKNTEDYARHKSYFFIMQQDWNRHYIHTSFYHFWSWEQKRIAEQKLRVLCHLCLILIYIDYIQGLFSDLRQHQLLFERYHQQLKALSAGDIEIKVNPDFNWFHSAAISSVLATYVRRLFSGSAQFFRDLLFLTERTDRQLTVTKNFILASLQATPRRMDMFSEPIHYVDTSIINVRFIFEFFLVLKISVLESDYFHHTTKKRRLLLLKESLQKHCFNRRFLMMSHFLSTLSNLANLIFLLKHFDPWPYAIIISVCLRFIQLFLTYQQFLKEQEDLIEELKHYEHTNTHSFYGFHHARKKQLENQLKQKQTEFNLVLMFSAIMLMAAMMMTCAVLPAALVPVAVSTCIGLMGLTLFMVSNIAFIVQQYQFEIGKKETEEKDILEGMNGCKNIHDKTEQEKKDIFLSALSLKNDRELIRREQYLLKKQFIVQLVRETVLPFLMLSVFFLLPIGPAFGLFAGVLVCQLLGHAYLNNKQELPQIVYNEQDYKGFLEDPEVFLNKPML